MARLVDVEVVHLAYAEVVHLAYVEVVRLVDVGVESLDLRLAHLVLYLVVRFWPMEVVCRDAGVEGGLFAYFLAVEDLFVRCHEVENLEVLEVVEVHFHVVGVDAIHCLVDHWVFFDLGAHFHEEGVDGYYYEVGVVSLCLVLCYHPF